MNDLRHRSLHDLLEVDIERVCEYGDGEQNVAHLFLNTRSMIGRLRLFPTESLVERARQLAYLFD